MITAGNAHFVAVLPNGTVLGDDTGTGIGFLVVCFTGSSSAPVSQGHCDLVLPAPFTDTNLQNGHLLNNDGYSCPDGIVLRDPLAGFADAISYEGQVPNVGAYGAYFHITPLTCSNWVENAGASIAGPNVNMDVVLPLGLGTVDIAQVLRLNDD